MSSPCAPTQPPVIQLPNDLSLCHQLILQQHDAFHQLQHRYERLEHRLEQLLKARYGPKADRLDPSQLLLFALDMLQEVSPPQPEAVQQEASQKEASPAKRRGHGRKSLSEELPCQQVVHDLTELSKQILN